MPLSRLDNFLKNVRGNTIYVNPQDLDATDDTTNTGNSMGKPFVTIQRALLEASRFSYQKGFSNDRFGKTTIVLGAGDHYVDNRPGWIPDGANNFKTRGGSISNDFVELSNVSNFDITDEGNVLYKLNSIYGGVIVPRGTSIIANDIKKTKIRPYYVPSPTNTDIERSAIFRITGGCYIANFSILDADPNGFAYDDYTNIRVDPNYSHHKLTVFEYADGVNQTRINDEFQTYFTTRTDLDMYYEKVGLLYGNLSGRAIEPDYPNTAVDIQTKADEYRIVGAISGEVGITSIKAGNGVTPSQIINVTLEEGISGLNADTDFIIDGVSDSLYNGSYSVQSVETQDADGNTTQFTYEVPVVPTEALPPVSGATVTLDVDTTVGSSPYFENLTLRSVFGMCGAHADGSKVTGFKSMLFNQFTGIGLQKDDNAFVKFNSSSGTFDDKTSIDNIHADANAKYKPEYYNFHIKASNNAFCQIVSNFSVGYSRQLVSESGGEFSASGSTSNFGQTALSASGFRNKAFDKDDIGYLTQIIPPTNVKPGVLNIEYGSIDVEKTINGSISRLYLYLETNKDDTPPSVIQGYRIGAKVDDEISVVITRNKVPTQYFAKIVMPPTQGTANEATSVKVSEVARSASTGNDIVSNTITFKSDHQFENGETIRVISDNARLPDGLNSNQIYFAITSGVNADQIQIATTPNDAASAIPVQINNLGGNLTVESRVSDKIAGDIGHPVQYDTTVDQWYVNVSSVATNNTIYDTITSLGTAGLGEATPRTFIQRQPASRGLDDTIYRLRYVIPAGSGITSARPPRETFMISASGDVTGATDDEVDLQFNPGSVTLGNENDMRNFSFIRHADWDNGTASYTTELPHHVSVGAKIEIENVISTNNTTGVGGSAYNGSFTVTGITSANQFVVEGTSYDPGYFNSDTSSRVTTLPTFKKITSNANLYIYNVDQISEYVTGEQDGVYYLTGVTADNVPQVAPFNDANNFSFSQPIVDLYPQFDRDNPVSDTKPAKSYALPERLGEVVIDDLKNSVSRESVERVFRDASIGIAITDIVSVNSTTHDIHTMVDHGLNRITSVSIASSGVGYGNSTGAIENLYNATLIGSASGTNATARITVTVSGQISDVEIMSGGSNYQVGDVLSVTGIAVTTGITTGTVTVTGIYDNTSDTMNVTGISSSFYEEYNNVYSVSGITSSNVIRVNSIGALTNFTTSGIGSENTRAASSYISGETLSISNLVYNNTTGSATVTTTENHGYRVGNSIKIGGANESFYNDKLFVITENVNLTSFVVNVGVSTLSPATGGTKKIYRSGLYPQNGAIGSYDENFGGRSLDIYSGITAKLNTAVVSSTTDQIEIETITNYDFKIGDYLRIDDEIMRIKTTVTGNPVSVFRGLFGTKSTTHIEGSVIRRISVPAIELRKPSIIKASSHTFEYVGYGPGNYSTALPDRQDEPPSQTEQLLSQSFRSNGGQNVYVGMNDVGDYYIGNKKISSSTGRETIFDTPLPTISGEDPSSVNVQEQFSKTESDEITVSRDLIVEGGPNSDIISEFNGPVLFTQKITSTSDDGIEANNIFLQGDTNISRKYTVGISTPVLSGNPGDIVFNANPESGGTVGWTYTIENGWYKFGGVSYEEDSDVQFVDKLGIATDSLNSTGVPATFQIGSGSNMFHVDAQGGVGLGDTANGAGLRVTNGNILGTFIGDGSGLVNVPVDSSWRDVVGKNAIIAVEDPTVGIKNLNPNTNWGLHVGTNGAGTNDLLVENKARFDGDVDFNTNINVDGTLTVKTITITDSGNNSNIDSNKITTNDLEVGDNVLSAKAGGGVAIGREDARADLDVDGTLRLKSYYEDATSVTSSANVVTIDLTQGQIFELTPNETVSRFTLTNVPASSTSTFTIKVTQGGTPRSVDILDFRNQSGSTIPVYWNGQVLPVVTPTANSTDIYTFMTFNGGSTLYGFIGGQNFGNSGADPTPDDGLSFNSSTQTVTVSNNLNVVTNAVIGGNILPDTDNTGNVGTSSKTWAAGRFTNFTVDSTLSVRGAIDLADNDILRFGSSDDAEFYTNGSHFYLDLNGGIGNFYIRDGSTTRFTFNDNGSFTSTGSVNSSSVSTGSVTSSSLSTGNITSSNITSSGSITASGNVTATNLNSTSDISMKTDVSKIENSLDIINNIDGVSFKWKDSGKDSLGVIAQTVESILPQLIHESGNIKSVNYNGLTGVLIECVKQLTKRVEELENK